MNTIILNKLSAIATQHQIKILFACESGSRGWQFPSPDSDYDVRFIYIKPYDAYLSIMERDDQLSFPINDELDIYGWDLRKVLQLIRKSNTTPFEWLQSPIVYREVSGFRNELWSLCPQYFSQRANIHHYLGIAKGALSTIEGNEIKIKKLFYVLRPLLCALWCLERNEIAPMTIEPLMTLLPKNLEVMVKELIVQKSTAPEGFLVKIQAELKTYIDHQLAFCGDAATELAKDQFEATPLDQYFRKIISHQ